MKFKDIKRNTTEKIGELNTAATAAQKLIDQEQAFREDLIIKAIQSIDEKQAEILKRTKEIREIENLSQRALDKESASAYKKLAEKVTGRSYGCGTMYWGNSGTITSY